MKIGDVTIEQRTVYEVHVWDTEHSCYTTYTHYDRFNAEEVAARWREFLQDVRLSGGAVSPTQ